MSKSRGPEQTPPETTKDLDPSPTHAPEGFGAMDMSPEGLHERSLGNSERASRLDLGGGDNTPALSDLNVEDWMSEPEASDVEQAPLPYKSELERGFGADLSGVTVRLGAHEELDAQGAEATAEGETLSFASTHPDRELVAHEVAHLVQSREHGGSTSGRLSDPNEAAEQEADEAAKTVAEGGQAELKEGVTGVMRKKTKTPKNNSGKRPGGTKVTERWGVTIDGGSGTIDVFELHKEGEKYFSDGSRYLGPNGAALRGQNGKKVNLNYKLRVLDVGLCIMARRTDGGNFWTPLTNIVTPGDFVGSDKEFQAELLGAVIEGNVRPRTSRGYLAKKFWTTMSSNLRHATGAWRKGWAAEMEHQRFVLRGSRVKPPDIREVRGGNMLSDYIPGVNGRPLYLNMNTPKGDVAPVVGDVLPWPLSGGSNGNSKMFQVYVLDERTTKIWKAGTGAIEAYEMQIRSLKRQAKAAQQLRDVNLSILENLNKQIADVTLDEARKDKFEDEIDPTKGRIEDAEGELAGIKTKQTNLQSKNKRPKVDQEAGTITWRYVQLSRGNNRNIEGWVPYLIKL